MQFLLLNYSYFVIYAFLGWCCEVSFAAATLGKFVNRGFLNGPVCPIYGAGAVTVILLLEPLKENMLLLFIGATVLTSLLEWLTGFILEKFFHEKWWDYTDEPFNLSGYICLKFSVLWGLACCLVIRAVHPLIVSLVAHLPHLLFVILMSVITAAFVADLTATVFELLKLQRSIRLVDDAERRLRSLSDKIGEELAGKVISGKRIAEGPEAEELRAHCRRIISEAEERRISRLTRAFPNLANRHDRPIEHIKGYLEQHKKQK